MNTLGTGISVGSKKRTGNRLKGRLAGKEEEKKNGGGVLRSMGEKKKDGGGEGAIQSCRRQFVIERKIGGIGGGNSNACRKGGGNKCQKNSTSAGEK